MEEQNFIIRCYNRYDELDILLSQLKTLNINNIKLVFNGGDNKYKDEYECYYLPENRGYQLGELDLLNKSFELMEDNKINHLLLTGCYIYRSKQFLDYINNIVNTNNNLFIPLGSTYNFKEKMSYDIINTYFVGGIFSVKKKIKKLDDFDVVTIKTMISNLHNGDIIKVEATDCIEDYLYRELNKQFTNSEIYIISGNRPMDHYYGWTSGICRLNRHAKNYNIQKEQIFK